MMNGKRGIAPIIIIFLILAGVLAIFGIGGGFLTALKINQAIQSIPTWLWGVIIGLLILMLLPRKK